MRQEAAVLLQPVLEIWHEVLDCNDALRADSNFFLSGGDSLDLTRVLIRVRERLGVELDMRAVLQFSTPARMAQCCAVTAASRHSSVVAASRAPASTAECLRSGRFPCTEGQTALWLAEHLSNASGLYNTALVIHLSGQLQVAVLARALTLLLLRHEVLRSRLQFDVREQRLFTRVDAAREVMLEPVVLPTSSAVRQFLRERAAEPFDLESGPLWRFQLVTTAPQDWSLLLCMHHCVSDGWSGHLLLRHLAEGYNAVLLDTRWQPARIDCEYRLFCLQPEPVPDTELHWWREYLRGADQMRRWPRTGPYQWPFVMAREEQPLDAANLSLMQQATRVTATQQSAFFLTALRLALHALCGIDELCIGMPTNVRNRSSQEKGVGYFVNLLVTRGRIAPGADGLVFLRQVQQELTELLCHSSVPFPRLTRYLQPALLPSGNAWCDVLFAFQNLPQQELVLAGMHAEPEALTLPRGQHPLKVEIVRAGAGCTCRIEYAREVFAAAFVRELLAAVVHQVAALAMLAARSN
jgi:acyl carrier protein